MFVAVGHDLAILKSSVGTNWARTSAAITNPLVGINYSSETYVAGGDAVTFIYPDRSNAPPMLPEINSQLRAVSFGDGMFVVVGDCGWLLTSQNGDRWTAQWSGTSQHLYAIAWGANTFVAVGDKGTIITSRDGAKWKVQNSGTRAQLNSIAYGNGKFMAVGEEGVVLNSEDGAHWSAGHPAGGEALACVAFGNDLFMVCHPASSGGVAMSSDGQKWLGGLPPWVGGQIGLTYAGGRFIATGDFGLPSMSRDGREWTKPGLGSPIVLGPGRDVIIAAAYGKGLFVGVGTCVVTSSDGATWRRASTPDSKLLFGWLWPDSAFFPNTLRALRGSTLADFGAFPLKSTDCVTWQRNGPGRPIVAMVFGNARLYAFPDREKEAAVLASENGVTWVRLRPTQSSRPRVLPRPRAPTPAAVLVTMPSTAETNTAISVWLNGQGYALMVPTPVAHVCYVQGSTDLLHWTELAVLTNSPVGMSFADPDAKLYPQRFYRLRLR